MFFELNVSLSKQKSGVSDSMISISKLKQQIADGYTADAIRTIDRMITECPSDDKLYYLRGNAYYKQGVWHAAINDYLEAIALNPDSPAAGAYAMLMDILEFYNKDIYNQ